MADELKPEWLEGVSTIDLTGASVPDILVRDVIDASRYGFPDAEEVRTRTETITLPCPPAAR